MSYCTKRDQFCFICGKFTVERNVRARNTLQELYLQCYNSHWIDDAYAPQIGCTSCYTSLKRKIDKKHDKPKYKFPMTWFDPGEHNEADCYFCVNTVRGINSAKRSSMEYLPTQYAILPIEHTKESPVIESTVEQPHQQSTSDEAMDVDAATIDIQEPSTSEYVPSGDVHTAPVLITQAQLNNMCRRLELSQRKSQLLASMLKDNNLLVAGVTISSQKNRQASFIPYFQTENDLSFCSDIGGLMEELNIDYVIDDWRLFIDASRSGLKAVLLHNDHMHMPIPIAYSRVLKETHNSMKLIFSKVKYNEHKWDVSGDLKVVALIMGLQLGRTKNSCFICTWVSTAKINHYEATWEKRSSYEIGFMNVKENSLVPPEKILLPTLHIKLGLISSYIRKLNKESDAFKYLEELFPRLSHAKISAGKRN